MTIHTDIRGFVVYKAYASALGKEKGMRFYIVYAVKLKGTIKSLYRVKVI